MAVPPAMSVKNLQRSDHAGKEYGAVAVGQDKPECAVNGKVQVNFLVSVRSRSACRGQHGRRRALDSLFVHGQFCDVADLGTVSAVPGQRRKIAFSGENRSRTPNVSCRTAAAFSSHPPPNAGKRQRV